MKRGCRGVGSCIGAALCVLVQGVPLTHAATLSPTNQSEIDALLTGLKMSGCQFNRNGTWYSPQDAQAHLARKLDYLVSKNAVSSTEQFIERAATKSSVTGQAYAVRCGNAPLVSSSGWLSRQLQILRAVSSKAGKID